MIDPEIATIFPIVLMTLERLAILVCIAFIWTRLPFLKSFKPNNSAFFDKKLTFKLLLFFSLFGIIGTLAGIVIDIENISYEPFTHRVYDQLKSENFFHSITFTRNEADINFRVMVLVVAGLLGGPIVGLGTGIIVGLQRWSLGGFSDLINCSTSVSVGLLAGLLSCWLTTKQRQSPYVGILVCFLMEFLRRAYLVSLSDDGQGELLMKYIALPMIIGNTLGGYIFMKVIEMVNAERQTALNMINTEKKLTKEKIQRVEAEKEIREEKIKHEEIKSLLLYMVPHFIISTLGVIKAKIKPDPIFAEEQLLSLATFTGNSLESINNWSTGKALTINDEINHITDYLIIMQGHYPAVSFSSSFDKSLLHFKCSLFVLQPLVENAINYGCKYKEEGDLISVSIIGVGDKIHLSVKDNGEGIADDIKVQLGKQIPDNHSGTGRAFYHIIQSLKKIFNDSIDYEIISAPNEGTEITLIIPKEEIDDDE